MSDWYHRVTSDLINLADFLDHFEKELIDAKKELDVKGSYLEKISARLPSIVEIRYSQLQEIEAVLEYLNLKKNKKKCERFRHYIEHYNRQLTARDAEKFAEGDKDYYDLCVLSNQIALLRNQFLAIHKGLDQLSWQIGNITRLKCAGLDDAML